MDWLAYLSLCVHISKQILGSVTYSSSGLLSIYTIHSGLWSFRPIQGNPCMVRALKPVLCGCTVYSQNWMLVVAAVGQ